MAAPDTLVAPAKRPAKVAQEEYPCSDGRVLMETEPHAKSIVAMRNQLESHFEGKSGVYVAGSMAVYYREGDRSAVVEPDVFVAQGVAERVRNSYRIWDEGGVAPGFVVEVASKSTRRRDATDKREVYEGMGVGEYWRFDPVGDLIRHRLTGWRLGATGYRRIRSTNAEGWYHSDVLALELRAEGWLLRFRDPLLGQDLMTHSEMGATVRGLRRRIHSTEDKLDLVTHKLDASEKQLDATEKQLDATVKERDEANRRIRELEALLQSRDNPR